MRNRAFCRHQQKRAECRALRFLNILATNDLLTITPHRVQRFATDRTPCSCPLCGNPRRYLGKPTIQERRRQATHDIRPEDFLPEPHPHISA